jgi:hypothetical protein
MTPPAAVGDASCGRMGRAKTWGCFTRKLARVGETGPDVLLGEVRIAGQNLRMAPTRRGQFHHQLDRYACAAHNRFSVRILESTTMRSGKAIGDRPPPSVDWTTYTLNRRQVQMQVGQLAGVGGPGEIRTHDLFHAMEARSQLRHRPIRDLNISWRACLPIERQLLLGRTTGK